MSKKIVLLHTQFSKVLNEEMKSHGIKSSEFMLCCHIKHDSYSSVKKVAMNA